MKWILFNKFNVLIGFASLLFYSFIVTIKGMERLEPVPKIVIKEIINESADYIRIDEHKRVWVEGQKPNMTHSFTDYIAPGARFDTEIKLYKDYSHEDELQLSVGYNDSGALLETIKPSSETRKQLKIVIDNDLRVNKLELHGTSAKIHHKKTETKTKLIRVYNRTNFPIVLEQPETENAKGTFVTVYPKSRAKIPASRISKFKYKRLSQGTAKDSIFYIYHPTVIESQMIEKINIIADPSTGIPEAQAITKPS